MTVLSIQKSSSYNSTSNTSLNLENESAIYIDFLSSTPPLADGKKLKCASFTGSSWDDFSSWVKRTWKKFKRTIRTLIPNPPRKRKPPKFTPPKTIKPGDPIEPQYPPTDLPPDSLPPNKGEEPPFTKREEDSIPRMPVIPPNLEGKPPTINLKKEEYYDNYYNNHKGRSYDGETLNLEGKNLAEADTMAAWRLTPEENASVVLGHQDFKQMFADYNNPKEGDGKNLSEEEWVHFHDIYLKNASGKKGRMDVDLREKEETVKMTDEAEKHLRLVFKTMDENNDKKVSESEFIKFNTEMFKAFGAKRLTKFEEKFFLKNKAEH